MSVNKNFFLIAICLLVILFIPIKINQSLIIKSNNCKVFYDEIMATSSNDAAKSLIYAADSYSIEKLAEGKKADYRDINLNLDKALERFYETLYLNLDIEDNYIGQQSIKYKIPIKLATGYDGYYLNYFKTNGKEEHWSEKKSYSMIDKENNLTINFTLDDYVYIVDLNTQKRFEGKRKEFETKYPNSCLKDDKTFETIRGQIINSLIKSDLEYYTYYSNSISTKNNWNIGYDIPNWGNRNIDSISFMAFYQGKVFEGVEKNYNSFGFGSSKTREEKPIYGYMRDGKNMYSPDRKANSTYFPNEFEAAQNGFDPDLNFYTNFKK